jgi:hypothetical protein
MIVSRSMMSRRSRAALALCSWCALAASAAAQQAVWSPIGAAMQSDVVAYWDGGHGAMLPAPIGSESVPPVAPAAPADAWIAPPVERSQWLDTNLHLAEPGWGESVLGEACPQSGDVWLWQVLPSGLIYRSYQAGVREPRLSLVAFRELNDNRSLWDGTLGGRVGLLRYGTVGGLRPQGWQLDVEAAAIARLTLDEIRDFETADYRVGVPLTYGIDNWQFKFAVYHLSSHLGDEFAISHPGSLNGRINYVRDAIVGGASYFAHPAWRLYAEAGYAANVDGGAEPWEFQFGTELSEPGPTGLRGVPFFAMNAHLREEHDFGGDLSTQAGWLWRGTSGQVARLGIHYYNGKSSQYQTFNNFEEQLGVGLWFDY